MKRFWPLVLAAAGFLILFGGFAYDLMYAGIPDQDPTIEMSTRYDFHATVASYIYGTGALVFFVGFFASIVKAVQRFALRNQ